MSAPLGPGLRRLLASLAVPALALPAVLSAAGCGGGRDAFQRSLAAGDRAKSSGRYDEAAAAYHQAADEASRPRDRDEGRFREAATLEQAGRHREAMEVYDRIIAESPRGERTARAVFERAWLEIAHGDAAAGWQAIERAIVTYPEAGSARRALREWVEHLDEGQKGAGRAWLEAHREQLGGKGLGEDLHYMIARSLRAEGKVAEARAAYVACAERYPYPFGSLNDDSWWNAAELAEQTGDHAAAVEYLRQLLKPREVSTMKNGSYERPRYSAAQFKLAELYRDRLGDEAQARREFRRLYTDMPTSVLRDDALWQEALLARKARDQEGLCEISRLLVREFPESRYAGCAPQLCASVAASPKAPACRGYLQAALGVRAAE